MTQNTRTTPELTEDQEALLWGTSDEALLTTFASLTHRIHVAPRNAGTATGARVQGDLIASLRVQRDIVQGEILRRMAGGA